MSSSLIEVGSYRYTYIPNLNTYMVGDNSSGEYNGIQGKNNQNYPKNISFKSSITGTQYTNAKVTIVSDSAFLNCGKNGKTKSIFIHKYIKRIENYGFDGMNKVTSLVIEKESELEYIGLYGLSQIGIGVKELNRTDLVLPSTVLYVHENGIYNCNLFQNVVYCGSHKLENSCEFSFNITVTVLVLRTYTGSFLGQVPQRILDDNCLAGKVETNFHTHLRLPLLTFSSKLIFAVIMEEAMSSYSISYGNCNNGMSTIIEATTINDYFI